MSWFGKISKSWAIFVCYWAKFHCCKLNKRRISEKSLNAELERYLLPSILGNCNTSYLVTGQLCSKYRHGWLWSLHWIIHDNTLVQCDQIGLFLRVLVTNFLTKINQVLACLGAFWQSHISSKNCWGYSWGIFDKFGLLYIIISSHTTLLACTYLLRINVHQK